MYMQMYMYIIWLIFFKKNKFWLLIRHIKFSNSKKKSEKKFVALKSINNSPVLKGPRHKQDAWLLNDAASGSTLQSYRDRCSVASRNDSEMEELQYTYNNSIDNREKEVYHKVNNAWLSQTLYLHMRNHTKPHVLFFINYTCIYRDDYIFFFSLKDWMVVLFLLYMILINRVLIKSSYCIHI